MNPNNNKEIPFKEIFEKHSVAPPLQIWDKVSGSFPAATTRVPKIKRALVYSAATMVVVAALLITVAILKKQTGAVGDNASPEQNHAANSYIPKDKDEDTPLKEKKEVTTLDSPAQQPEKPYKTIEPQIVTTPEDTSLTKNSKVPANGRNVTPPKVAEGSVKTIRNDKPVATPQPATNMAPETLNKQKNSADNTATVADFMESTGSGNNTDEKQLVLFVPNAFTPSRNGTNAMFVPVVKDNLPITDYKMQIFSKNGALLFESDDIEIGWDGRVNGETLSDQVCVYVITLRDEAGNPHVKKGTVTIIR